MKPRILHVIDHTEDGGAQVVVRQLIEGLGNEFEFSVAVLGRSGRFSETYKRLGIRVLEIGDKRSRWSPFPTFKLIHAIDHDGYDLIHTHLLKSNILGSLAAKYTGCKFILHDHSSISPQFLKFYFHSVPVRCVYLSLYRFALRTCERVIVLTPNASAMCHDTYSVDSRRIAVVPNGIDPHTVPNSESPASGSIHRELGLSADTRLVVMVGRLEPEKDWITFLKVAQYLPKITKIKFAFLVIGAGSQEQNLRDYATKDDVGGVYFLGYRNDVLHVISYADVFLLTSEFEPFGIALLEAMMVGCPIVATRSGGPESILTHEFNGLLAEIKDVESLANNVLRILQNDALRRDLIRNARKTVVQSYSIQNSTSFVADIYQQVLRDAKTVNCSRTVLS